MERQVIQLYRPHRVLQYVRRGSELRPHGWLAPIHRLLWRLLSRLGAIQDHMEETTTFVRVPIDTRVLVNRVASALDGIHLRGGTPKEILMGPNAFAELMNAPEVREWSGPFSFDASYSLGSPSRLFSLPVHVLPQMEGVLVR